MSAIAWFEDLGVGDVGTAGGKGANLGELTRAGLPVPRGFVVTADAYLRAMTEGGVRDELDEVARSIDVDDDQALVDGASRLQDLVRKAGLGVELRAEIVEAYGRLHTGRVAVRSSATAEDTSDSSFAGMNQTFTNITGADDLCARIVDCWASLYGARVVAYRRSRASLDEAAIAVIVQVMVASDRSGVMFTVDPSSGDATTMVIEAAFGLGEVVVGGQVEPDTYRVAKAGPSVTDVRVGVQTHMVVSDPHDGDRRVELTPAEGGRRVLTDP